MKHHEVSKMATLFENYEQQYSVLTAEITSQIGQLNIPDTGKNYILYLYVLFFKKYFFIFIYRSTAADFRN